MHLLYLLLHLNTVSCMYIIFTNSTHPERIVEIKITDMLNVLFYFFYHF